VRHRIPALSESPVPVLACPARLFGSDDLQLTPHTQQHRARPAGSLGSEHSHPRRPTRRYRHPGRLSRTLLYSRAGQAKSGTLEFIAPEPSVCSLLTPQATGGPSRPEPEPLCAGPASRPPALGTLGQGYHSSAQTPHPSRVGGTARLPRPGASAYGSVTYPRFEARQRCCARWTQSIQLHDAR
jgi:hypothetical protein